MTIHDMPTSMPTIVGNGDYNDYEKKLILYSTSYFQVSKNNFKILLSWTYVIQNSVLFQKMYGSYLEKLKIESNLDFYCKIIEFGTT